MRRVGPGSVANTIHGDRTIVREANYSAFNGYHFTPSDYSLLCCQRHLGGCGSTWRTKARYVDQLPNGEFR